MEYWSMLISIAIGALGIYYLFKNYNFFKRHGIIHVPPVPILGAMTSIIFRRASFADFTRKLYNFNSDAKYIGFYATTQPILLLRDPELFKEVFVKSFEVFPNRRGFSDIEDPLFKKNLFSLKGQKWRDVRTLLSPAFTSNKMKTMFVLMSECATDFATFLSTLPSDKSDMDMKDAFTKYTNDVIATCAFGIKIDSMRNPTNEFYVYGKEATSFTGLRFLKFIFVRSLPKLAAIIGVKFVSDYVTKFFRNVIKNTIDTRDANNITRPDMLQLMMDVRGKGEAGKELDIDDMTAQAFIFFFGGFDTSSTAMSFAAHEIAANPDVQNKLRQEIDKVLDESNGEVTYEAINSMKYLDAFGLGPRMCIANRFALLEVKVVLFHLLARCELKPCAKTTLPMRLSKKITTMTAEGGFWLNVQRRNDIHPSIMSTTVNGSVNF